MEGTNLSVEDAGQAEGEATSEGSGQDERDAEEEEDAERLVIAGEGRQDGGGYTFEYDGGVMRSQNTFWDAMRS